MFAGCTLLPQLPLHVPYHLSLIDIREANATFGEFSREAAAQRLKVHIYPTFGRMELRAIKPSTVRAARVERGKVVPWTVEQVQAVIAQHPPRRQAIRTMAAGYGLRQGEVFVIAVEDVHVLGRMLHVRHQVKRVGGKLVLEAPKDGRVRSVPLGQGLSSRCLCRSADLGSHDLQFSCDRPARCGATPAKHPRSHSIAAP